MLILDDGPNKITRLWYKQVVSRRSFIYCKLSDKETYRYESVGTKVSVRIDP